MKAIKVIGSSDYPKKSIESIIASIPRFCYRKGFEPFDGSRLRSDKGWGCCYRSSQGIIAQFILKLKNNSPEIFQKAFGDVENPLVLFSDKPSAPFGIHNLVRATYELGVPVGKWAKLSVLAEAIRRIMESYGVSCLVSKDSVFNIDIVPEKPQPTLIILPSLLGLGKFDETYLPFLQLCLCVNGSLGFVSGKKDRSYYFFAMGNECFYYFDPHTTKDPLASQFQSLYELEPSSISMNVINPSIMTGFACNSLDEIKDLLFVLTSCPSSPLYTCDKSKMEEISSLVLDIDELPTD